MKVTNKIKSFILVLGVGGVIYSILISFILQNGDTSIIGRLVTGLLVYIMILFSPFVLLFVEIYAAVFLLLFLFIGYKCMSLEYSMKFNIIIFLLGFVWIMFGQLSFSYFST